MPARAATEALEEANDVGAGSTWSHLVSEAGDCELCLNANGFKSIKNTQFHFFQQGSSGSNFFSTTPHIKVTGCTKKTNILLIFLQLLYYQRYLPFKKSSSLKFLSVLKFPGKLAEWSTSVLYLRVIVK